MQGRSDQAKPGFPDRRTDQGNELGADGSREFREYVAVHPLLYFVLEPVLSLSSTNTNGLVETRYKKL